MAMVGAGVGGGFISTNELRTLTFDQTIKTVHEEYENMKENGVTCDVPKGAKVLFPFRSFIFQPERSHKRNRFLRLCQHVILESFIT
jgi:hypothetical protein